MIANPISRVNPYPENLRVDGRTRAGLSSLCSKSKSGKHVSSEETITPKNIAGVIISYDRCKECNRQYERAPTAEEMERYQEIIKGLFGDNPPEERNIDIFA